jgi:hypothetical protein
MKNQVDHDRIFKELITTFFLEFIQLFFPKLREYLDDSSLTFLDKEIFTDVTAGEKYESDLIAQVKVKEENSYFLVHIEAQAKEQKKFNQRMFTYFARLHEKFAVPIYLIVIFSYQYPKKLAPNNYEISFPDLKVLEFNYRVVQLNRLDWRDYLSRENPVAAALMSKMQMGKKERAKVKAECLRLLVTLKLDRARMQLISGFVDTYLTLSTEEEIQFQEEISEFNPQEQEGVMQITTSWMRQGLEQGLQRGLTREKELIIRLITRKLGKMSPSLESEIINLPIETAEDLGEALLDFNNLQDLQTWLTLTCGEGRVLK